MKKMFLTFAACLALVLTGAAVTQAATQRLDAIWARTAADSVVLDGVLDEADWAQAESYVIDYATDAGIPGSGWKSESGWAPIDPTHAVLNFLVRNNQLYMGVYIQDQSIGGSTQFNRFDGLLMGLKDHTLDSWPKPASEYFYSWWHDELTDPQPTGTMPGFIGAWAELPHGAPRTPEQIAAWDAVTVVDGVTNDDAVQDVGYTIEMRFDLTVMGYDVTQPGGDVVEWNISLYDCDWFWPINVNTFSSNRVWWQGPWGNTSWYNEVRIFGAPEVTTTSGPAPVIAPEMSIKELADIPTIDGVLGEAVWTNPDVYTFDIQYDGGTALYDTYDGVGPFRAGQFQPDVNGGLAFIADPADATVKLYHRGNMLYMGFESRDAVVQYHPDLNRWDGFIVTIDDRVERGSDNQMLTRRLSFQVGDTGQAVAQDDLLSFVTGGSAQVAVSLMAGTTVDTFGTQADTGFTAELALDLTSLGYPADLGDGAFFFGVTLLDGDSFLPITDSYGTRTWWYREFPGVCCPTWAHLVSSLSGVPDLGEGRGGYAITTGGSGPSSRPDIRFAMPDRNLVTLEVYDVRGRLVEKRPLGEMGSGENEIMIFPARRPGAGVYLYRLHMANPVTGMPRGVLTGKVLLIK
ncbi:hypothetical protein CO151_12025 [bacterium CG_4_9_14_3_um_filter_65_15]|nr:MAG: hypothetical protein CO151_12025 [bacterium CG_4_9_14_3_um_filter_65_15]